MGTHSYQENQCAHCGKSFLARKDSLKIGRGRFCSKQCSGVGTYKVIPIATRFWSKVKKTRGCWVWTAGKSQQGYGTFSVGPRASYKNMRATRVAYVLTHGPISDGMFVCHRCDNPACVRPEHLFLGTAIDNQRDMVNKGRSKRLRGEDNGQAKLTANKVLQIRMLADQLSQSKLAYKFNVSQSLINAIIHRRRWSHL